MGKDIAFALLLAPLDNKEDTNQWVAFPTTPERLRDAFQSMGIGPNDWQIVNVESYVKGIRPVVYASRSLDELNCLAILLSRLSEKDLRHFEAVAEIEGPNNTVMDLINISSNLHAYKFYEGVKTPEELGRHLMRHGMNLDTRTLNDIDQYIDFERFGCDSTKHLQGHYTESCFVYPSGSPFTYYYRGDPGDLPEEYRVTHKIVVPVFSEEELIDKIYEWVKVLDYLLRAFSSSYARAYPDAVRQVNDICQYLYNEKRTDFETLLDDLNQTEQDVLPMEMAEHKAGTRYDPAADTSVEKIRVLVVEPRKAPYVAEVEPSVCTLEYEVGGAFLPIYPSNDLVAILYNKEGKKQGLELNRSLYDEDGNLYEILAGTFLVVGWEEANQFTSLSDEMIRKYTQKFQTIEDYAMVGGKTYMFQIPKDAPVRIPEEQPYLRNRLAEGRFQKDAQGITPARTDPKDQEFSFF